MYDKFVFADGLVLSALDSTGIVSTNIWDLEEDAVTDGMLEGWINILITAAAADPGNTEGLWFELRSDDTAALSHAGGGADEQCLGAIWLAKAELVAGREYCFGFHKDVLGKYIGVWSRADSTSVSDTLTVDIQFALHPSSRLNIQKKNATAGAS